MSSGIAIDESCRAAFTDFKQGKKAHRFISFTFADDLQSVVADESLKREKCCKTNEEAIEETKCAVTDLLEKLNTIDKKPRWIFVDYEYLRGGCENTSKIVMIKWCPEGANIKHRMVFTSSEKAFINNIGFTGSTRQCDCADDVKEILDDLEAGKLK